jgi:hypothetical protein
MASPVLPHLPLKLRDLRLLPLHRRDQTSDGGAERLGRARLARSAVLGPELALSVDEDRPGLTRDRLAADPGDEGRRLCAVGPDPDRPRLAALAGAGDGDIVRAGGQAPTGVAAEGDVERSGGVAVQRVPAGGDVGVAGGVREQRVPTGGDVVAAGGATLLLPVVFWPSAFRPVATLKLPVVLWNSGKSPAATLLPPVVLSWSAPSPVATLARPSVLSRSAATPAATLRSPAVSAFSARWPRAVLMLSAGEIGHYRAAQADFRVPVKVALKRCAGSPAAALLAESK